MKVMILLSILALSFDAMAQKIPPDHRLKRFIPEGDTMNQVNDSI
jgi:hypothetical protein